MNIPEKVGLILVIISSAILFGGAEYSQVATVVASVALSVGYMVFLGAGALNNQDSEDEK